MNQFPGIPDDERGLIAKYRAFKIEDASGHHTGRVIKVDGFPVTEITEPFFLLKFDDPYAEQALLAYARACEDKYPMLASDIRRKLNDSHLEEIRGRLLAGAATPAELEQQMGI